MSAAQAELERRYRRLLRLYPHEFRARRETEMLGVLMAAARDGQSRPALGDAVDLAGRALLGRLRGPRGGWMPLLTAFTLLAPLFLVLTDIVLIAIPHQETVAAWQYRVGSDQSAGATLPPEMIGRHLYGGIELLTQPGFVVLVAGHLLVAAAVLAGRRRTALAILLAAALADSGRWGDLDRFIPPPPTVTVLLLTGSVFLLESFALVVAAPRAARGLLTWRHAVTGLVLAAAVEAWSIAAHTSWDVMRRPANPYLITGFALAGIALVLPLVLGLGWRVSLLLAALSWPCALGVCWMYMFPFWFLPFQLVLFLPPLLVACWSAAAAARGAAAGRRQANSPGPAVK